MVKRGGGPFGPVVMVAFLFAFLVFAIVFAGNIFGSTEEATNVTNMTNSSREAYNATTGLVQTGMTLFDVMAIILVVGCVVGGAAFLIKAVR